MNGTNDGYNHEISSPGWGFGAVQALARDEMGIAQLSARLLVAPDGLTFENGTCGELLGYAWMALPLIAARSKTAGLDVPTGDQSWTLFLNSRNFKGAVAFYTPATWSRISRRHPPAVARGLDARPGLVTGGAIEVNTVPRFVGHDSEGATYSRIPRLQFPADGEGRTVLIHKLTHYSKAALYEPVRAWLAGGAAASGRFDEQGALVPACKANPLELQQGEQHLRIRGLESRVETRAFDTSTFGLQWKASALEPWTGKLRRGSFPEYCKQEGQELAALSADAVPAETGLKTASFLPATAEESYTSPDAADDVWHKPGPKAGPFEARLADGSVVVYSWYRFVDQPALQDADLGEAEKQQLQALFEKLQAQWTPECEYMPPPSAGTLAALDPALLVTPPRGLERGCVPIAVRQSRR